MSKRILVPIDGSEQSADALRFAVEEWPDAELTLLHVINPADSTTGAEGGFPGAVEQWYESAELRAESILSNASESVDRKVETRIEIGRPVHTITDVTEEGEFDLVVVGSQGRSGLSRVLLGSVAEGVIRKANVPVTVVR